MSEPDRLIINSTISIPMSELAFQFTRSSGPGGQHVNKAATQVELIFDVARSPSLPDRDRQRVAAALGGYIDKNGILRLSAQSTRSQLRNRQEVIARFRALLQAALKRRKRRRPTRPTAESRERRLEEKKRRGAIKRSRRDRGSE